MHFLAFIHRLGHGSLVATECERCGEDICRWLGRKAVGSLSHLCLGVGVLAEYVCPSMCGCRCSWFGAEQVIEDGGGSAWSIAQVFTARSIWCLGIHLGWQGLGCEYLCGVCVGVV